MIRFLLLFPFLLGNSLAQEPPALAYRPLSEAAGARGQLARYASASGQTVRLKIGETRLTAHVPGMVQAYDVVPVRYTLTTKAGTRRAAVEATAFEDPAKVKGRKLHSLSVPGNMDVKIEYLGSVSGDLHEDKSVPLTADPQSPVSPYPIHTQDPLTRTSEIRAADHVWFKWRLTNTGDTILDPEGLGACFGEPRLVKLRPDGTEEWTAQAINIYVRFLNYLYPGETVELWTMFYAPKLGLGHFYGLTPGDYRLDFLTLVRLHRAWDWGINIWGGTPIASLSVLFTCTEKGSLSPVKEEAKRLYENGETMPGYLSAFEEFLTGFAVHPAAANDETTEGVIYVQVAPWTKAITVRLVLDKPTTLDSASVPMVTSAASLAIRHNPDNPLVLDGQPIFVAQAMPGMRSGVQLGPDVTGHLRAELREMKTLGVNVIANTAGDWITPEIGGSPHVDPIAAQYKWYYDVLVREEKMKLLGWSVYPPDTASRYGAPASKLLGKPVQPEPADVRYSAPRRLIDLGDPIVPEVIAAWALYNYHRWGDLWYRTRDGVLPIDIEDTRGWLRDDINIRYPLGQISLQRFRNWLKDKYQAIEKVNQAWGTTFATFAEIDPQGGQGSESNNPAIKPVYNQPDNPFHDWNKAVEDWDRFRTWLRMDNYAKALEIIRKEIPEAKFEVRTENSNLLVTGDPDSPSLHLRHIFYSQRRAALVFDEIKNGDLIGFSSDYTLVPYTTETLGTAVREMVRTGIRPILLPCFNHMRDIVLNEHYGREYQQNYHLAQPARGIMIHTLVAAFPWWKTTYENGGAPGIIWSDYLCDAFATETQKRELAILTHQFRVMKNRTGE